MKHGDHDALHHHQENSHCYFFKEGAQSWIHVSIDVCSKIIVFFFFLRLLGPKSQLKLKTL